MAAHSLGRWPSAELFGESDDDALGTADVAEQVAVLEPHHLADELGAVGAQAGDHPLDVVGASFGSGPIAFGA
jgi:hypothetical protein